MPKFNNSKVSYFYWPLKKYNNYSKLDSIVKKFYTKKRKLIKILNLFLNIF